MQPHILMTDPAHFDVRYAINPWMRPGDWADDDKAAAMGGWRELRGALEAAGARVTVIDGDVAWPDMVFAANAAVVFDRKCVLARFKHAERQGEESRFRRAFDALAGKGEIDTVVSLPPGLIQEGAGDFIWDASRQLFWAGFGPRSDKAAARWVGEALDAPMIALELATANFYHLDTCFCPLAGGEVLYYPPAFTPAALAKIRERVGAESLIEADPAGAAAFCVNAVNLGARSSWPNRRLPCVRNSKRADTRWSRSTSPRSSSRAAPPSA